MHEKCFAEFSGHIRERYRNGPKGLPSKWSINILPFEMGHFGNRWRGLRMGQSTAYQRKNGPFWSLLNDDRSPDNNKVQNGPLQNRKYEWTILDSSQMNCLSHSLLELGGRSNFSVQVFILSIRG